MVSYKAHDHFENGGYAYFWARLTLKEDKDGREGQSAA